MEVIVMDDVDNDYADKLWCFWLAPHQPGRPLGQHAMEVVVMVFMLMIPMNDDDDYDDFGRRLYDKEDQ